jgi:hypothetical protein
MNADAVSDFVLLLVCAMLAWRHLRTRPAVATAAALIGLAALLGVLRYSGLAVVWGPHRFFSLLAACAAFPLLAAALRWPDAPLAQRGAAVGRFVLVAGGVGVAMTVSGVAWWSQVVPGLSAALIVATVLQRRSVVAIAGALLLVGSFVVVVAGNPDTLYLDFFNSTQALHYLLAGGLALLVWPGATTPTVSPA